MRTMKRLVTIVSTATLFLALACTPEQPSTPQQSSDDSLPTSAKPFKVGLLTPGSIADGGWNAIAYEGLQQIQKELGAEISHQETRTPAEFEEGFRYFGSKGFNLAFGHGFEFQDAAAAAGKLFPSTVFITTSGSTVSANVAPMVFELEQATYLLGMIAALESTTGKAGLVGGIKLPSIDSTFIAFEAGAKSVNPAFEVKQIYTGNFDDVGAAKLAALTLVDSGSDFLFHQANEAGRGVFQACEERKIRCFGSNKNQNDLAPGVILASAVLDVPAAFSFMANLVRNGKFEPKVFWLGMREGIVLLQWNERLIATLKPDTIGRISDTEKTIRDGTFEVPRGKF